MVLVARSIVHRTPRTHVCAVEGCAGKSHSNGVCSYHWRHGIGYDEGRPTPHEQLTWSGWHRFTTPLPPIEAAHESAAGRYAQQNAADGIVRDPAVRAWLFYDAPWATESLAEVAD